MTIDDADWPLFGWSTDVRQALFQARTNNRTVILGTLTRVEGPAPRPVGTQMLFDATTATGYFSGGCLEADVANHAADALSDGDPRRLVYGRGSPWIDIRLLCGGSIEILLERIVPDDRAVASLWKWARERRPAWLASDGVARQAAASAIAHSTAREYVVRYDPDWRVIVVGGDPVALAITSLASAAGFLTTLIRPGGPDSQPPIAGIDYCRGGAGPTIEALTPDPWTAVISATHDDDVDDAAIIQALRSNAAYVGVLGSVRRIPHRRERLSAAGLSTARISALRAPIGAARCGKAPWEIAVSVMAEIMEIRAARSTDQMERPSSRTGLPDLTTAV